MAAIRARALLVLVAALAAGPFVECTSETNPSEPDQANFIRTKIEAYVVMKQQQQQQTAVCPNPEHLAWLVQHYKSVQLELLKMSVLRLRCEAAAAAAADSSSSEASAEADGNADATSVSPVTSPVASPATSATNNNSVQQIQ